MGTIALGTTVLPFSLVVLVAALLTMLMVAGFSFVSRGFVYDLVMPVDRSRKGKRRQALDTSKWY